MPDLWHVKGGSDGGVAPSQAGRQAPSGSPGAENPFGYDGASPDRPLPMSDQNIREASLEYHRASPPGKIALQPTKQLTNQRDLALAYSPGVAAACDEIVRDPAQVATLTARGNLIGVVTNGTAVLGLGAIGPLAAKPVMEGKAVLFKKFAGIDCFDIEIDERDPDKLVDMIVRARADVRRHQPRGHQGAGVLLHRAQAAASG